MSKTYKGSIEDMSDWWWAEKAFLDRINFVRLWKNYLRQQANETV